jgi:hypothetical protein
MQLYRYFVSQSSEFCRHNPLCCFSTSVCCCCLFCYRLSPETFGYTFVQGLSRKRWWPISRYSSVGKCNCPCAQINTRPWRRIQYLTKNQLHEIVWGSGGITPRVLKLSTGWRWVVSFTPPPLYPQGKSPGYPLDRRLGGPQSRSGRGGEEKNSQPQRSSSSYLSAIPLSYPGSIYKLSAN